MGLDREKFMPAFPIYKNILVQSRFTTGIIFACKAKHAEEQLSLILFFQFRCLFYI